MKSLRHWGILPASLIVDFYFFPFRIGGWALPNTKLMLAIAGLVVVAIAVARRNRPEIDAGFVRMTAWASGISFVSFAAIVVNNTSDTSYVSYIFSMFVWLVAAYVVVLAIRAVHGRFTLVLLCNYLMTLSVVHCALALLIDQYPFFQDLANALSGSHEWVISVKRLYSVGVELDTAGVRFSIVLVLMAYRLMHIRADGGEERLIPLYLVAFIVIAVVGSMIARTTYVGIGTGLVCMLYYSVGAFRAHRRVWQWLAVLVVCAVPLVAYFYQTNSSIRYNVRFAFEGFFNLAEKGEYEVGSSNVLESMIVFPETIKTWAIGDGYMVNPKSDPYYTGKITEGYYKNTDIGYLRFVFYFGLLGLLTFIAFFLCVVRNCIRRHPDGKALFVLLLLVGLVVWLKVATDVFIIFALLLFVDNGKEPKCREKMVGAERY